MAAPIEINPWTENSPWSAPYTVDTLFELPEADVRFEVLGGSLVLVPPPTPEHNYGLAQLLRRFADLVPPGFEVLPDTAVRLPNGDGPIPDLLVTSAAKLADHPKGLPADLVHTVVEVVSPSNAFMDRRTKTELYAEAGIPCYWRVEQRPWKEHAGPCPAIVVRLRDDDGRWQQRIAAAGTESGLPVVIDADGTVVSVKLDPAALAD